MRGRLAQEIQRQRRGPGGWCPARPFSCPAARIPGSCKSHPPSAPAPNPSAPRSRFSTGRNGWISRRKSPETSRRSKSQDDGGDGGFGREILAVQMVDSSHPRVGGNQLIGQFRHREFHGQNIGHRRPKRKRPRAGLRNRGRISMLVQSSAIKRNRVQSASSCPASKAVSPWPGEAKRWGQKDRSRPFFCPHFFALPVCRLSVGDRCFFIFHALPIISFWSDLVGFTRIWCGFLAFDSAWDPEGRRMKEGDQYALLGCTLPPPLRYSTIFCNTCSLRAHRDRSAQ